MQKIRLLHNQRGCLQREKESEEQSLAFIGWAHQAQVSPQDLDCQPANSKMKNDQSTAYQVSAGVATMYILFLRRTAAELC